MAGTEEARRSGPGGDGGDPSVAEAPWIPPRPPRGGGPARPAVTLARGAPDRLDGGHPEEAGPPRIDSVCGSHIREVEGWAVPDHHLQRMTRPEPSRAETALRPLGTALREARQARGLTLEAMAASLRIRRAHLAALEEGRLSDLPAPAYALGFLRSYARALGLDEEEAVRRFREGAGSAVQRRTELVFPEPVPERGVPAGAAMLLGAVVMIGAYAGWYAWSGSGERSVDAVPPLPPRLERLAQREVPPPVAAPAPPAAEPAPAAVAAAPAPAPTMPIPPPHAPPAAAAATAPAGVLSRLPAVPAAEVPAAAPAAAPPPAPAAMPEPAPDAGRILLRARSAEVWIQVRERPGGPVLVDRVLRPGEGWEAPPPRPGAPGRALVFATGNAPELEIVIGSEPPLGLGPGPAVRRNIPLEAERLRAGAASTATAPAHPAPAR